MKVGSSRQVRGPPGLLGDPVLIQSAYTGILGNRCGPSSKTPNRAHNCYYEPCSFYARKAMLHRFNFVNFSGLQISRSASVSDTFATRNAGQESLEELVKTQALSVDLREAVMACLSGGESRRWTVAELVERFKNLGVCASRASVTAALAELALELELSSSRAVAPARTRNRMDPGAQIRALRASFRRQTTSVKRAKILSEEHKAVLLVVIGYRRKGGVSKTRVGEILGLEASSYPGRSLELKVWSTATRPGS